MKCPFQFGQYLQETLDEITPMFYQAFNVIFAGTYKFFCIANVTIYLYAYTFMQIINVHILGAQGS